MPWIVIDTETQGLNAQRFLMGCIMDQHGKATHHPTATSMYKDITERIQKAAKRGERLLIYGHNLQYDYIAIGAHHDRLNVPFCTSPFIVDHYDIGLEKVVAKWSCTMGLWRGSLASLGAVLGEPKTETPDWLKSDQAYEPSFEELATAHQYMEQDCKVLWRFLTELRKKLHGMGIRPRVLLTAGQIAMSHFRHHLRKHEPEESRSPDGGRTIRHGPVSKDIDFGELWRTAYPNEIHQAYRGGRCEAFQSGEFAQTNYADVNSLYPYIAATMPFPRLREERYHKQPTMEQFLELLSPLSIWRVITSVPDGLPLGYLPVRATKGEHEPTTVYPSRGGTLLVGTWTGVELRRALQLGYTIHHVEWGITWKESQYSPFAELFPALYAQRQSETGFGKAFAKLLMNSLLGKFSQRRRRKEFCFIDQDELAEKRRLGWEPVSAHGRKLFLERQLGYDYKKTYAPILPTLLTARARDHMYSLYCHLPVKSLIYTDTDSILWDSSSSTTTFKYGDAFGELKLVHRDADAHVYAPKAYRVGSDYRVNRVPRVSVTPNAFRNGQLVYTDILPITNGEEAGKPVTRVRELDYAERHDEDRLYIDTGIELTEREFAELKRHTLWLPSDASSPHFSSA